MVHRFLGPLLIALAAGTATLATIAPESRTPGVTCDELYHVAQAKQLVTALRQQGLAFFQPANIDRNFAWQPGGPPVQAPLGYWILGWTHYLFDPAPDNPAVLSLTAARFAPAVAFALLVLLVGAWTTRREGPFAGTIAAAAVALTPRLFAHAHLAALDMLTTLLFVAAALAVAEAARGGRAWQFALAGVVWGAAMLVRLHGLLIAPPVVLWLIWRAIRQKPTGCNPWAWKGVWAPLAKSVAAWSAAGVATFFAGWPWLWLDPVTRFQQYLSSGASRQMLHVFYAGRVWSDHDVPWHYPWVMFAVTVPVGFLALGMIGIGARLRNGRARHTAAKPARCTMLANGEGELLAGMILFPLLVFSLPGSHVYDGVRLFLMVFPFWAVWVAVGAKWLVARRAKPQPAAAPGNATAGRGFTLACWALVALQATGTILYHPCQLSYYNLLAGGLPGAARLGFEVTYWGDAVREPMLAEAARLSHGEPILLAPSLAPFQPLAIQIASPALLATRTRLVGYDPSDPQAATGCRYAVVYHRRADLADVERMLKRGRVVMEYEKQGVWLARLVELDPLDAPDGRIRIDGLP